MSFEALIYRAIQNRHALEGTSGDPEGEAAAPDHPQPPIPDGTLSLVQHPEGSAPEDLMRQSINDTSENHQPQAAPARKRTGTTSSAAPSDPKRPRHHSKFNYYHLFV